MTRGHRETFFKKFSYVKEEKKENEENCQEDQLNNSEKYFYQVKIPLDDLQKESDSKDKQNCYFAVAICRFLKLLIFARFRIGLILFELLNILIKLKYQ